MGPTREIQPSRELKKHCSRAPKAVFVFSGNVGVWLRLKNRFLGKEFPLTIKLRPLTRKIFSAKILPSNHFRRCAKRERERERTRANKERERLRTQKVEIVNRRMANPRTANPRTVNPRPTNRADRTGESHCYRSHSRSHYRRAVAEPRIYLWGGHI